jgi:2-hydroxy-3-keto-5-methylthiopentenyl-1-phosphate phosphatase
MGAFFKAKDAKVVINTAGRAIKPASLAVLCDFDGTITPTQTMDFLYKRFAGCGLKFARQWERGEISTSEEIRATFNTVTASREEMERSLDTIEIDPGFRPFYDFARERGYQLAILSDGFEWYIEYILEKHGVMGIPIYANRIHFERGGFRFEFPWQHEDYPMQGVSKTHIAHRYRANGNKIVYIGDGRSDTEVIHAVNLIYAKGWLAQHCRERNISSIEFDSWDDLHEKWREP